MSKKNKKIKENKADVNRKNYTEAVVNAVGAHPFVWAAALCLFLTPVFYGSAEIIPVNVLSFIFMGIAAVFAAFFLKKLKSGKMSLITCAAIMTAVLAVMMVLSLFYGIAENKGRWFFFGGLALLIYLYIRADREHFREKLIPIFITGTGALLKLYYVLVTPVYVRQHDVGTFDTLSGHSGYISYILGTGKLPDFDVRDYWQFCHPPLHHIISAAWIYFNENILQVDQYSSRESLQMLTLFYSLCVMILAYKILRHFGLKGMALYVPLTIVNFHPTFIILSGSINNDILSIVFIMAAVLCTLKWYREPNMENIMKIALCIGFGMMAKLSAALVAPAVAVVFLIVFVKNFKKNAKKLIGQFAAFIAVCAPLGLWYQVRNLIKFGIPLTYVHRLDDDSLQYLGDRSFWERITDFSPSQLNSVFVQWASKDENDVIYGYNDFNPLVTLLKTSVFDECGGVDDFTGRFTAAVCGGLFWIAAVLAAVAVIAMFVTAFAKRDDESRVEKLFLGVFYAVMIVNFLKLSYDFPFTCSMNFRYITPTVMIGAVFIGLMMKRSKRLEVPMAGGMAVFAGLTAMAYLSLS